MCNTNTCKFNSSTRMCEQLPCKDDSTRQAWGNVLEHAVKLYTGGQPGWGVAWACVPEIPPPRLIT